VPAGGPDSLGIHRPEPGQASQLSEQLPRSGNVPDAGAYCCTSGITLGRPFSS